MTAHNLIASLSGIDIFQQRITGTTNKGQCVQVIRAFQAPA